MAKPVNIWISLNDWDSSQVFFISNFSSFILMSKPREQSWGIIPYFHKIACFLYFYVGCVSVAILIFITWPQYMTVHGL